MLNIFIKAKNKKTGQLYEPNGVFYIAGAILKRNGEIYKLKVFDNNTGIIHSKSIKDFSDVELIYYAPNPVD